MTNTTSTVQAIGEIKFEGNLVPQSWSHWLKIFNGGKTSGVIPIASLVLADIVYWYRPAKVDDEKSGLVKGYKAKFAADKLQRSYNAIAEQQAITKTQAKNAVKMLEDAGAITVEFRTINVRGTKLSNVMFLEPVPEVVALWQQYPYKTKIEKDKVQILYGELDQGLVDKYLSLCVKLPIPMRQKTHRSEQINKQVFVELQTGVCNIAQTNTENTTETSTEITSKITSGTSKYTQSISEENASSKDEPTGNFASKGGSETIDSTSSGTVPPGSNPDSCGASENDSHSQNEPYAKPWHKDEPLRVDKDGYAVLPPANKHKMPRQTAVKLAQYVLLAENDPRFELMLPDRDDCLDNEYPTDCWITSKNNCTWYRENELETTEPLRALRNVNEANGGLDFNELLNDCWRAATSLWDEDDALALFKRTPLPVIFEDFLEDYGVEVIEYDFDTLCPL